MNNRICKAVTKSGKPCRMLPLKNDVYCYIHSEKTSEQKKLSQMSGGKRKVLVFDSAYKPIKLSKPGQVTKFYEQIINSVMDGSLDLRIATGIGYLLNGLLKAMELSELEERLNNLETSIEKIQSKHNG